MMFQLGVLCALLVAISAESSEYCYKDTATACGSRLNFDSSDNFLARCNSKYGSIDVLLPDLQAYATGHIETSFEFLLMSSHLGNFETNRDGFKGLYRKYSDDAWEKAISIIQYLSKRGGEMNFNQPAHFRKDNSHVLDLSELQSLAKALDLQKQLTEEAMSLHIKAKNHKDSAVAHYIEEEFMKKQSETVRTLAGHTSDLKTLLRHDASLGLFFFDDYIKRSL